jgi:membrane protein DedA with SNARE-associated domain
MFEWINDFMQQSSYFGVALLMFVENVFPPIPSELIMPLAGFRAAKCELNPYLTVLAGTLGSVAGTLPWY